MNGFDSDNTVDNVAVGYNPFSQEYIVAGGGQIDRDANGEGSGDNESDKGFIILARVHLTTGEVLGAASEQAPNFGTDGGQILRGTGVSIACSSVTGNVLAMFGMHDQTALDTSSSMAGALYDSELTRLDTNAASYHNGGSFAHWENPPPIRVRSREKLTLRFRGFLWLPRVPARPLEI